MLLNAYFLNRLNLLHMESFEMQSFVLEMVQLLDLQPCLPCTIHHGNATVLILNCEKYS